MSDTSETGRWIQYKFTDTAEQVILEKQRKIPEHLEGATFWNKVGLVAGCLTKFQTYIIQYDSNYSD